MPRANRKFGLGLTESDRHKRPYQRVASSAYLPHGTSSRFCVNGWGK
jgi:hypothetical protein